MNRVETATAVVNNPKFWKVIEAFERNPQLMDKLLADDKVIISDNQTAS